MEQDADLYGDVYQGITDPQQQQQQQHFPYYAGATGAPPPAVHTTAPEAASGGDGQAEVLTLRQQLLQLQIELTRSHSSEQQLREELAALRQREASLQAEACFCTAECLQLRQELASARQAADPSVVQLRQVLLDPAVNREVVRLRSELEAHMRELAALQDELKAVAFSGADGKAGRMLAAKCRALQEENEELGRQLSEGRVASLERALASTREQLAELKAAYAELEDHAHALDDEAELLQQQLLLGRRHAPGPGPPESVMPPPTGAGRGRGSLGFAGRGAGRTPMLGRGFYPGQARA